MLPGRWGHRGLVWGKDTFRGGLTLLSSLCGCQQAAEGLGFNGARVYLSKVHQKWGGKGFLTCPWPGKSLM